MENILYRFALRSDFSLVSIAAIDNKSRELKFYCPSCSQPLRPRLGTVRAHHFYHLSKKSQALCNKETYLHWVSKTLLFQELQHRWSVGEPYTVSLFNLVNYVDGRGTIVASEYTQELNDFDLLSSCTGLSLEKKFGDFRPDITVERTDGKLIFLEIKVKHASSEKKRERSIIVEIDVSSESDFNRLTDHLTEVSDKFVNFDAFRKTIERPNLAWKKTSVAPKVGYPEEKRAIDSIESAFRSSQLICRLPHDFEGLLGGNHRDRFVEVDLQQYYSKSTIVELNELVYCQLSNEKGNELRVGFDVRLKSHSRENHYILLSSKAMATTEITAETIEETDVLIKLSELGSKYRVTISCFLPKGHYASSIRDYSVKEFRDLVYNDEVEVLSILKLRKT